MRWPLSAQVPQTSSPKNPNIYSPKSLKFVFFKLAMPPILAWLCLPVSGLLSAAAFANSLADFNCRCSASRT